MKCPACGYLSLERTATCGNCGAAMAAGPVHGPATQQQLPFAAPPVVPEAAPGADEGAARPTERPPVETQGARTRRKRRQGGRRPRPGTNQGHAQTQESVDGAAGEELAVSEEDLDAPAAPARTPPAVPPPPVVQAPPDIEEPEMPVEGSPIIDRVEEIPARFWAPRGAGVARRTVAVLVDLALLAALLGLFLAGGALALWREGLGASALLSESGLEAALGPLALLVVLAGAVYHVPALAVAGRTPGKRLAGLEVRAQDGSVPSWGKAALRWCGAMLGLACGGAGLAWALFEPRRRGWADLVSDTLVVEFDPAAADAPAAVDFTPGRGYHAPAVQGRDSSAGRATD